ncbi:MAG TPA: thioredoxin-dependent thiol peroxidase [Limnochordia bacterium]
MPQASEGVREGAPAPDFTLPDQDGKEVRLSDLRGQAVVLYMYPKDDTPGCTREACDFRDNLNRLTEAGAVVLGLSPDSPESHRKFREKYHLPFRLLSDEGGRVAEMYGAWGEKQMFGRRYEGVIRSTFVIDPAGVLRRAFRNVSVPGHVDEVLQAVQEIAAAPRR